MFVQLRFFSHLLVAFVKISIFLVKQEDVGCCDKLGLNAFSRILLDWCKDTYHISIFLGKQVDVGFCENFVAVELGMGQHTENCDGLQ